METLVCCFQLSPPVMRIFVNSIKWADMSSNPEIDLTQADPEPIFNTEGRPLDFWYPLRGPALIRNFNSDVRVAQTKIINQNRQSDDG